MRTQILTAALITASLSLPALADGLTITDPYARSAGKMAKAGAAFMVLENTGDTDDRLVAAASDIAAKVELHTHIADGNGVMRMVEVEDGFAVPAGQSHALKRGGDHVMFMGLKRPLEQGEMVTVTLTFEEAGEMQIEIPVDLTR
ncbi:MAG: copper chaperone PCu(A)C [Mangrovicoccus sp.]